MSSPWQQSPPLPAVQTSKEGGRTSNPNRQRSSGSFLKGHTPRRRRAREGRGGRPRPSGAAPSPPPAPRGPGPASAGGGGGSPGMPSSGTRWRRPARPPAARRGCVCARWGRGPARLSPAGSPPPGRRPRGRFLPPDRADAGRREAPRSLGDSASERFPRGLGERVRTNSSRGAQQLRRGRSADRAGPGAPRQKASPGRAAAAAPSSLPH